MANEIISGLIENYGIGGLALFVIAAIVITVAVKYLSDVLSKSMWPFKRNKVVYVLDDHVFFTTAKFKLHYDIPTLDVCPDKPVREEVFKNILYLTVESFYYGCKNIIGIHGLNKLSGEEWGEEIRSELRKILKSYERKAEDFDIPKPVIKVYTEWLATYMDILKEYIIQLSGSSAYGNSLMRTNTFLLIMNLLVITMVGDLAILANREDNSISGIDYRGRPLED